MDRSEVAGPVGAGEPEPGLVLVFGAGRPVVGCVALARGAAELGREHPVFAAHPDPRVSRRHAEVRFEGSRCIVTDCGSRNGLAIDGEVVAPGTTRVVEKVLRIGDSLFVPVRDLGPFLRLGVRVVDGRVEGPGSQAVLLAVQRAASFGTTLHITGVSGAGKEGLARAFHAAGPAARGPLQAVNCATIPEGVAERLLFGTKRGAYSGADADAEGYVQAAHGGTLFLDEIAELALPVQAKLLRTLETGEVVPLGASRPRKVELRFCSATHTDLRRHVAAGKFREDLYYRIATPSVAAPPLRERLEEIPWLLQLAVERTTPGQTVHVSLVEACLLRRWPGNVRELLAEVRTAAQTAIAEAAPRVEARHLGRAAGVALTDSPERVGDGAAAATKAVSVPVLPPEPAGQFDPSRTPTREWLINVLRRVDGNVSAAAREFGVHRTQLRRWLERHGIDVAAVMSDKS